MSVSFCLPTVVECTGRTAKWIMQANRLGPCPFETYPASPAPFTMTSVAFPKSIFSELASNLPRHACRTGESITMSSKKSWLSVGITSFNAKISLIFLFLLLALPAFAAGGSCPSGANYLNSSGSLVTLSSLGVTSCYYIAANGSDSNNGTTEATPWLHAPGMPACASNCATVQNANPAGAGYILRGGDTWHFGNSSASPYAGGNSFGLPGGGGTSAYPIYFGVDQSWYSGGSWARPIFTEDNPPSTSQKLSSCTFPTGSDLINFGGGKYFIVDNLELTGACTTSAYWNFTYVNYGSLSGYANFYNLYIHGWSHVGFPNPNNCTNSSTCMSAFRGGVNTSPPGETLLYDVVDGSDSDPVPMEFCYCGAWRVAFSYFNNGSQFITRNQNSFHDSAILNFVDNGHANVMESVGDAPGPSNAYAIYNNIFGHLYASSATTSNVGFWPSRPVGSTEYWFNNIVYDAGPMEFFNIGLNGQNEGTIAIFNNTFQFNHRTDGGADGISCSATGNAAPYVSGNNHFMSDDVGTVGGMYAGNCSGQGTDTNSLLMTNRTATSDGYTGSQTYAFSPTSGGSPTVGTGTNRSASFCGALTTASGTDSYLTDAAAVCQHDTRYACTYSSSNHTVSCPARTVNARPGNGSGNWDIGAYEYGNPLPPPNPPTGLSAVVN